MKTTLVYARGCLIGILILAGVILAALLFLRGGVWLGEQVLPWFQWSAAITLVIVVVVLLPLAAFWRTRRYAARWLISSASIFGLTLWLWGLVLTYNLWGGTAVLVGLFLLGVGVVPMALIATLFAALWSTFGQLVLLAALTVGTRYFGAFLLAKEKLAEQKVYELEIL